MEKSIDLLEGSRSLMEGERGLLFCFGRAGVRKKRQSTIGEKGERYKYPLAPTISKVTAVPLSGCASLQVRHYHTRQDSMGKSKVMAILAVKLRIYMLD